MSRATFSVAAAGGDAEALSAGSPYSTPWRPGPCTERPEPSARTLPEGPRGAAAAVGATQTDKELSVGSPPRPFLSVSAKQPLEEPRPRPPPLLRCCAFSVLNTSARRASGPEGPGDRRGRGRAARGGLLAREEHCSRKIPDFSTLWSHERIWPQRWSGARFPPGLTPTECGLRPQTAGRTSPAAARGHVHALPELWTLGHARIRGREGGFIIYFFLFKHWRKGRKNFLTNLIVLKVTTSVEQKRKMGQRQARTLCTAATEKPRAKMPGFTSDGEAWPRRPRCHFAPTG